MSDQETNTVARARPRADASAGLDVDALRRQRDRELAGRSAAGAVAVDVATLWHGRLARHEARRQPSATPSPAIAGSSPTSLYSLPPVARARLWQGERDEGLKLRVQVVHDTLRHRRK